jgi:hypothetical protein
MCRVMSEYPWLGCLSPGMLADTKADFSCTSTVRHSQSHVNAGHSMYLMPLCYHAITPATPPRSSSRRLSTSAAHGIAACRRTSCAWALPMPRLELAVGSW